MSAALPESLILRARRRIALSDSIMAITGAGISAESGIPTFRTEDGLWNRVNPEEFATPAAFARDPDKVWRWYDERRTEMAGAEPNAAHRALAELERRGKRVFIVTQNVDDLHERAGSTEVVHVHGSIWRIRCERDGTVEENRETPLADLPPYCHCGEVMRPDVVWFGEELPWEPVQAVRRHLLEAVSNVCLVIGTEASFGYILQWVFEARDHGATVVTVNPRETGLDSLADLNLKGKAGDILPRLIP